MSTTTSTTQREAEASAPRRARPARSAWLPDVKAAEDAVLNCKAIATSTVDAWGRFDKSGRDLAKGVYDLICALIPEEVLISLRRPYGEQSDEEGVSMPREVLNFLRKHDLPRPPLHAVNPFLGFYQYFWNDVEVKRKTLTATQVKEAKDAAGDIKKLRADKAAENTMVSRYAKLVMVAVDMDDASLLDKPFREVFDSHVTFIKHHPTLLGKPPTTRGRPPKDTGTTDTTTKPPAGGSADHTVSEDTQDFEAGVGGYDPFKDPAMTGEVDETETKPKVPDSAAEEQLDADLRVRTAEAAQTAEATETQPADKPVEDQQIVAGTYVPRLDEDESVILQPLRTRLVLPTQDLGSLDLSAPVADQRQVSLDVDGVMRIVNHRTTIEPIKLDNKQLIKAAGEEGLLRYKKVNGEIVILETLAWD